MVLQISSEYQILFMLLNQRGYSDYGEDSWKRKFQDFCSVAEVIVTTKRVLWAPAREQLAANQSRKNMHSFSRQGGVGFSFGNCLSVWCDGISTAKLLRGVVSLCFCQMTENPSGLAGWEEVGRKAFSVIELGNFVLGRISLICFCSPFDSYYKGDTCYKAVVNSSNVLSPVTCAPSCYTSLRKEVNSVFSVYEPT